MVSYYHKTLINMPWLPYLGWILPLFWVTNVVLLHAYTSTYMQNHNDTINKQTSEDFFKKIYLSFYCKGCVWEELETEQNCNILTPTLMAISVVSFPFSRATQQEAQRPTQLSAGFLYRLLSPTGLQTPSGVPRAPSAGCGFPYHICLQLVWSPTPWLPVHTELYNSSIAHSIAHAIFGMACLIFIKRK